MREELSPAKAAQQLPKDIAQISSLAANDNLGGDLDPRDGFVNLDWEAGGAYLTYSGEFVGGGLDPSAGVARFQIRDVPEADVYEVMTSTTDSSGQCQIDYIKARQEVILASHYSVDADRAHISGYQEAFIAG